MSKQRHELWDLIATPILSLDMSSQLLTPLNELAHSIIGQRSISLAQWCTHAQSHRWLSMATRAQRSGLMICFYDEVEVLVQGALLHTTHTQTTATQTTQTTDTDQEMKSLNTRSRVAYFKVGLKAKKDSTQVIISLIENTYAVHQIHNMKRELNFLQSLINLVPNLFFVLDQDLRVAFANRAFYEHCGEHISVISHVKFPQISDFFFHSLHTLFINDVFTDPLNPSHNPSEARLEILDQVYWSNLRGEDHSFQMILQPLRDQRGQTHQILIIGTDITALLNAHEEQRRLQSALEDAQRLESIGQMAGTIAHDFNGFLTIILSSLSLLEEDLNDPDHLDLLEGMTHVSQQARQLTQDLLAFSRSQIKDDQYCDLLSVSTHMEFILSHLLPPDIQLHFNSSLHVSSVVPISESQCTQMIVNLVTNARDAITDGGMIQVDFTTNLEQKRHEQKRHEQKRQEDTQLTEGLKEKMQSQVIDQIEYVLISVRDTGEGISAHMLKEIFEPFFTTKKDRGGTGLGLASVYGIVKGVGGDVVVDSVVGEGTSFTISLPLLSFIK